MLRRSPTALTITPADISDFETFYTRRLAHQHYLRTGEDPHKWFSHDPRAAIDGDYVVREMMLEAQRRMMDVMNGGGNNGSGGNGHDGGGNGNTGGGDGSGQRRRGGVDPSDELKPLPGDKARIVRGREERIVGHGGGRDGIGGGASGTTGSAGRA